MENTCDVIIDLIYNTPASRPYLFAYGQSKNKGRHMSIPISFYWLNMLESLQVYLHTVASSNQQLHIVSQFSLIVLIMPHPTPIDIRHQVLALAREGMWRSDIACHVGLTRATVNHTLQRHAATGTLLHGKSTGVLGRAHLIKNVLCSGWSDRITS